MNFLNIFNIIGYKEIELRKYFLIRWERSRNNNDGNDKIKIKSHRWRALETEAISCSTSYYIRITSILEKETNKKKSCEINEWLSGWSAFLELDWFLLAKVGLGDVNKIF